MAAYGSGDQVSAAVPTGGVAGRGTWNLPNFVGQLFFLSPMETPFLTLSGGITGGRDADGSPVFTWQDTLHRTPAIQSNVEGDDATFSAQKRNERSNVVAIHQYGVETTYTKMASTGLLGTSGAAPATSATSILGTQPVMNEHDWQMRILIEQAALDVEVQFLTGTLAYPNDGTARQTQGIVGAVDAATTTTYPALSDQAANKVVIDDLVKKLFDNGAPMQNCVIMVNSLALQELENAYSQESGGWNLQPRSRTEFGVNIQTIVTSFGTFDIVANRHLDADTVLILEMGTVAPRMLPIPGKGHFFVEPLAKSGSYDRDQLYGEIGLEYGPGGWHAKADNLHAT